MPRTAMGAFNSTRPVPRNHLSVESGSSLHEGQADRPQRQGCADDAGCGPRAIARADYPTVAIAMRPRV
jgi:hypothetical protein